MIDSVFKVVINIPSAIQKTLQNIIIPRNINILLFTISQFLFYLISITRQYQLRLFAASQIQIISDTRTYSNYYVYNSGKTLVEPSLEGLHQNCLQKLRLTFHLIFLPLILQKIKIVSNFTEQLIFRIFISKYFL